MGAPRHAALTPTWLQHVVRVAPRELKARGAPALGRGAAGALPPTVSSPFFSPGDEPARLAYLAEKSGRNDLPSKKLCDVAFGQQW
jgi:hypothetical protein